MGTGSRGTVLGKVFWDLLLGGSYFREGCLGGFSWWGAAVLGGVFGAVPCGVCSRKVVLGGLVLGLFQGGCFRDLFLGGPL